MDLALLTSEHQGVTVLSASGEIDLATVPRLRDRLVRLATEHPGATVVIDLDGVGLIDSTGLGVLVGAKRRLQASGGELRLVVSDPRLVELFSVTGLDAVLPIHATLHEALGVSRHGS